MTDLSSLPSELILKIVDFISLHDHAQCVRANRRYEENLSRSLYARLLPLQRSLEGPEVIKDEYTRKNVMRWAINHGSLSTLRKVDDVEPLEPFINSMALPTTRPSDKNELETLPLSLLHLASLRGHDGIARFLLEKGADVIAAIGRSLLPIHFAKTADIVQILLSHGSALEKPEACSPIISSLAWGADASATRAFLDLGLDPNSIDSIDGARAAEPAIKSYNIDALQALMDAGADVREPLARPDRPGEHLLYTAIWSKYDYPHSGVPLRMVRMLLEHGADASSGYISSRGDDQWEGECFTPYLLLASAMPDSADIFELLIQKGADIHAKFTRTRELLDQRQWRLEGFEEVWAYTLVANLVASPMYAPVQYVGEPAISLDTLRKIDILVQHGQSIDSPVKGPTPLHFCLGQVGTRTQCAIEMIPHLIALGADVSRVDGDGYQPLHKLTAQFYSAVQKKWMEPRSYYTIRLFHPSPLTTLMDLLIDHGADPNAVDIDGRTPLMHLCRQPPKPYMSLLIKELLRRPGIEVDVADKWGCTALHYVVGEPGSAYDHETVFRLQVLLNHSQNGIEVNPRDNAGRTPLHLLLEADDSEIVARRRNRITMAGLWRRGRNKRRALVMLIRAGAHVHVRVAPTSKQTPLLTKRREEEETLMAETFGADATEAIDNSSIGDTPLHLACRSPEPATMIEVLLRHGAAEDVNSLARHPRLTPLMMLAGLGTTRLQDRESTMRAIRLLLGAGARPGRRNVKGNTAWSLSMDSSKRISQRWVKVPWLEELLPPDMEEEQRWKVLGLGATERNTLGLTKS